MQARKEAALSRKRERGRSAADHLGGEQDTAAEKFPPEPQEPQDQHWSLQVHGEAEAGGQPESSQAAERPAFHADDGLEAGQVETRGGVTATDAILDILSSHKQDPDRGEGPDGAMGKALGDSESLSEGSSASATAVEPGPAREVDTENFEGTALDGSKESGHLETQGQDKTEGLAGELVPMNPEGGAASQVRQKSAQIGVEIGGVGRVQGDGSASPSQGAQPTSNKDSHQAIGVALESVDRAFGDLWSGEFGALSPSQVCISKSNKCTLEYAFSNYPKGPWKARGMLLLHTVKRMTLPIFEDLPNP